MQLQFDCNGASYVHVQLHVQMHEPLECYCVKLLLYFNIIIRGVKGILNTL